MDANEVRMYLDQESQIAEMKQAAAAQRAENAETASQLEKWRDPEYVRIMAREEYYVSPGETPLVVMDHEEGAGPQGAEPGPVAAPDRWYDTLWNSVQAANTEQPSNPKPQN